MMPVPCPCPVTPAFHWLEQVSRPSLTQSTQDERTLQGCQLWVPAGSGLLWSTPCILAGPTLFSSHSFLPNKTPSQASSASRRSAPEMAPMPPGPGGGQSATGAFWGIWHGPVTWGGW